MTSHAGRLAAAACGAAIVVCGATASEAAIKVTSASITGGKLVLTGQSPTGTSVRMDDKYTAKINLSDRTFRFAIPYLPLDCKVDLTLVGATAAAVRAVIAYCGQAGPAYAGRQTIEDTTMSLQVGTTLSITGFSFKPPVSGKALIRGRGHCVVAGAAGATTKFQIFAAPDLLTDPGKSASGLIRVNEDANADDHLTNWTFESSRSVTEGVVTNVLVNYFTSDAAVSTADCGGTVSVEVFNGNLSLVPLP